MRAKRFGWEGAENTARAIRAWDAAAMPEGVYDDVEKIRDEIRAERDVALRRLTATLDGVTQMPESLRVEPGEAEAALAAIEPALREAMEVAAGNIRLVAEAQTSDEMWTTRLPQGQTVAVREVPVASVGVYAPGGRAVYPSSVLMCAIPARVAGVDSIALASPPGPGGRLSEVVLAAAALCEIDEIYTMGGAQAIFALTYGTETVIPVDVIAGPGNAWVQEAKRAVMGVVGIDSYAGPSELMVIAGHDTDPEWAALDLCAQAEHGPESPLVVVAVEESVLDAIAEAAKDAAATRPSATDAPLALVQVPDLSDAIDFANAFAPEHLELLEEDAALQSDRIRTAGCVFVGHHGATAFGDYAAGSNHVLPTTKTGRFSGPLGPGTFRRRISTVEIPAQAAAKLAPYVDALARAEGLPIHGESAMIRG
ncbi:MAG TPA: histidinol dehydrogenase [Solirubrobacterales bacterium]|jgi:histidinol dehydrogenase|nr:histidinol dehydrogenase [Solirubrobacterales bacterium]